MNTLIKSMTAWTPACPGASSAYAATTVPLPAGPKPGGCARIDGASAPFGADAPFGWANPAGGTIESFGMRLRGLNDLRSEQRVQDEQGRPVFELIEDMSTQAPATAHVGASLKGGVSGPYPWRRPV
ncbi:hypothetical protein [Actinomadura fibrosa]|uniref:Uncharacterized protein n=1 Tax=Actinomadura fibrosa TaxID=111802 RepID=A0ABW2XF61_9ACTN|nr:hypothetical protein [Actinomadura fibrosa]